MNNVENFIVLKPIAEKFRTASETITDKEIKDVILSEIRNVVRDKIQDDMQCWTVDDLIQEWCDNNENQIIEAVKESLNKRLDIRDYEWR